MNAKPSVVMLGTLFLTLACTDRLPNPAPPAPPSRAAPLPTPFGWEIWPISRSAMFTGAGRKEVVYLTCSADEAATLSYWVPPDAPRSGKMTLVSGSLSTSLEMVRMEQDRANPPPNSAGEAPVEALVIAVDVPNGDPVMRRFLETGELTLVWGPYSLAADARPEQLPALRRNCL